MSDHLFTQFACSLALVAALSVPAAASDETPGPAQSQTIALTNAAIHPVTGPVIERGAIVFDQGRIIGVGANIVAPANAKVIDLEGKHVYPGLIAGPNDLGLTEIRSVRATRDQAEGGSINPNVKAQVAVNPDSEHIPVARANGVLFSLAAPSGGLVAGTSALIQLDGWSYEDMTVSSPVGMHLSWPRMSAPRRRFGRESPDRSNSYKKSIEQLEELIAQTRAYIKARKHALADRPAALDARLEAMIGVIDKKIPLIVRANGLAEIQAAVAFAAAQDLRLMIYGGYDAHACAALLKQRDVAVIVSATYRLPRRRDDAVDQAYALPNLLHRAGVRYCIAGGAGASMLRNLPYHAAAASAHGLPGEEALKAVTIYPAQLFGAADRIGSLEVGKDASLMITDGDPLEITTQVHAAYLQGRPVDLNNRHKRLWKKYEQKYQRLEK